MVSDAIAYAKQCHNCLIHGDFIHQAPRHLHPTSFSWPFEMWGIDIIGPITPPTSKGHRFILAKIDYFSKWVEVIPLKEVKTSDVINFIKHHVLTALMYHDKSSMIMDPCSSAKHFRDSVINSEFKVCL